MRARKAVVITTRVPKAVKIALEKYVELYNKEICMPRGDYTDVSKMIRAMLIAFLEKKGLLGYEFDEYLDPCYSDRVTSEEGAVEPTPVEQESQA